MSKKSPSSDKDEAIADAEDEATVGDKAEDDAGDQDEIIVIDEDEVIVGEGGGADATGTDDATEVLATDPDPVQIGEADAGVIAAARDAAGPGSRPDTQDGTQTEPPAQAQSAAPPKRGFPWFGLLNFLLLVALAGAAGYYWREQQKLDAAYRADIAELQAQLDDKAGAGQLQSSLSPLRNEIGALDRKINELGLGQQSLRETSEKLFELYGRDKNDWQLAEVEYLMRVAQHKLILQDDFEGAAITLQAASDRIGLTGDPGLLPVRLMISEEIADLKTRRRADLVGMTLRLAQLGRQVRSLQPGYALRVDDVGEPQAAAPRSDDWLGRFNAFLDSLISIRKESTDPTEIEANVIDVAEALEDNLKLARWAVLERDANQYQLLIDRSLQLFREFYDLDNAANQDFMAQLQELQKMVIRPEKPDITGSLREMQRILSQREAAPQPAASPAPEAGNG